MNNRADFDRRVREIGARPLESGRCCVCGATDSEPWAFERVSPVVEWSDGSKTLCACCKKMMKGHAAKSGFKSFVG